MSPSEETTTPEPPVDRPTKMRWGCLLALLLGGLRKGTKAVVVYIDGSAKADPLSPETQFRVLRFRQGKPIDIFTREGGLPEDARILNPE